MSVKALSLVVFMVKRTPLRLKVEHIELEILVRVLSLSWSGLVRLYEMYKSHLNIFDRMCKTAVVSVFTLTNLSWIHMAELSFVLIRMVQALNPVVCSATFLVFWTSFRLSKFTKFRCIHWVVSSSVFNWMIEKARFVVVRYCNLHAFVPLEILQHKMRDFNRWAVDMTAFLKTFEKCSCLKVLLRGLSKNLRS
jgi:hypothetical protein